MILEKLSNIYSSFDLKQKINEIIEKLIGTSDKVDSLDTIFTLSIEKSKWVVNTGTTGQFYTYTILSMGVSKVFSVYRTSSDEIEQVFPDKITLNNNGTITIYSPVSFNGYVLVSRS